eukprot:XP_001702010.1 predicted protein [Chlamydomonas reinhardtii]
MGEAAADEGWASACMSAAAAALAAAAVAGSAALGSSSPAIVPGSYGGGARGGGAEEAYGPAYSEGSAYAVYDARGEPSSWEALLYSLPASSIVLLGEYHDDPVAHALQLRLLRHTLQQQGAEQAEGTERPQEAGGPQEGGMLGQGAPSGTAGAAGSSAATGQKLQRQLRRPVALSLEMFEADVQHVMDEFLAGAIREADLVKDGRPWPNYQSDYRPLVMAAKEAGAPVVCANAPRRYVSLVGRSGAAALEALPPASRRHLPPLPLRPASNTYAAKIQWTMQRARQASAAEGETGGADDDGEERAAPVAAPAAAAAAAPAAGTAAKPTSPPAATAASPSPSTPTSVPATNPTTSSTSSSAGGGGECPYSGMSLGRTRFVEAQNLWDASMAHAIAAALQALPPGGLVVHVCGKFHSEQRLGICEHLNYIWGGGAGAPAVSSVSSSPTPTLAATAVTSQQPEPTDPSAVVGQFQPQQPDAGQPATPRVCVVTFVPSGRGVSVPAETLRGAGLHTYGDWLVLTDARLPRSFESEHPV